MCSSNIYLPELIFLFYCSFWYWFCIRTRFKHKLDWPNTFGHVRSKVWLYGWMWTGVQFSVHKFCARTWLTQTLAPLLIQYLFSHSKWRRSRGTLWIWLTDEGMLWNIYGSKSLSMINNYRIVSKWLLRRLAENQRQVPTGHARFGSSKITWYLFRLSYNRRWHTIWGLLWNAFNVFWLHTFCPPIFAIPQVGEVEWRLLY